MPEPPVTTFSAGVPDDLSWSAAVYAVSFWHYLLYWRAYRSGTRDFAGFKRAAMALKCLALAALALPYVSAPFDVASLALVAAGFLLNAAGAHALGWDRTYYGHEAAGLPHRQVTTFPYSWIPHPMIAGNVLAFGGTLVNPDFRRDWWPLAGAHVAMNLGLLVMELAVTPRRQHAPHLPMEGA